MLGSIHHLRPVTTSVETAREREPRSYSLRERACPPRHGCRQEKTDLPRDGQIRSALARCRIGNAAQEGIVSHPRSYAVCPLEQTSMREAWVCCRSISQTGRQEVTIGVLRSSLDTPYRAQCCHPAKHTKHHACKEKANKQKLHVASPLFRLKGERGECVGRLTALHIETGCRHSCLSPMSDHLVPNQR
ncbi:hypothetical protein VTN96DRAFT_8608 [Rasamsonia emersonii]